MEESDRRRVWERRVCPAGHARAKIVRKPFERPKPNSASARTTRGGTTSARRRAMAISEVCYFSWSRASHLSYRMIERVMA